VGFVIGLNSTPGPADLQAARQVKSFGESLDDSLFVADSPTPVRGLASREGGKWLHAQLGPIDPELTVGWLGG
jgi:hypothetical protein